MNSTFYHDKIKWGHQKIISYFPMTIVQGGTQLNYAKLYKSFLVKE